MNPIAVKIGNSMADCSMGTWGGSDYGGDSSQFRNQLQQVQQIRATAYACAAILHDGSAVSLGDSAWGGDSIYWQEQLKHHANDGAFAAWKTALCSDMGTTCAWR